MGFLDDAKDQLTDAVDSQGDKTGDALEKGADFVGERAGGKFDGQLDTGADEAKDALDSLDGRNDDIS